MALLLLAVLLSSPAQASMRMSIVQHLTRVKIIESNNLTTRPGSVYDIVTRFESLFELPKPGFNYIFVDTGLGAAEPLYPMLQIGHQASYWQLIPAFFSKRFRHIDHETSLMTPEGCHVDSLYLLRHIDEFPELYAQERSEGYENIVIRLEYYTQIEPGVQCGRHKAFPPDPSFDVKKIFKEITKAKRLTDIPAYTLARFDARVSAIRHLEKEFSRSKWPRFDRKSLAENSLWYYQEGFDPKTLFGEGHPQPYAPALRLPQDLIIPGTQKVQSHFPLRALLKPEDFQKLLNYLNGRPTPEFQAAEEPGRDTLRLSDVSAHNIYTSGLEREPIQNVFKDVSNPDNFVLSGMVVRPYETQENDTVVSPQIRFVFQVRSPNHKDRVVEQLFLHLTFNALKEESARLNRSAPYHRFLKGYEALISGRRKDGSLDPQALAAFVKTYTSEGLRDLSFSSSLTGIWIFGALSADPSTKNGLQAKRIVREGIDVGFYSSLYDNDLFRKAAQESLTPQRKRQLKKHLEDLTVTSYRDAKRNDVHTIRFERMTCAQCHQMSGRDAVHLSLNDGIDSRQTEPIRASEFLYQELNRQLELGERSR